MNFRRIALTFAALWCCLAMLTGCWDRKEMDELAFVMASGLDLAENGELVTSLQIALPIGLPTPVQSKGKKSFVVLSDEGKDGIDTLNKEQQQLSRTIKLGLRRVIVIGESLGRHGLNQVLDTLMRSPESRYNSYIVTAYGTTAKEVLSTPYLLEEIPADGINNILKNDSTLAVKADEFLDALAAHGKSPVTAGIQLTKDATGNPTFKLDKIAAYRSNKLVGFLSGDEQKAFRLFRENIHALSWAVQFEPPNPEYKGTVNMNVLKVKRDIHTRMIEEKPAITVHLTVTGIISANDTELDMTNSEVHNRLERKYEDELKKAMESAVSISQQEFKSDIFGFGRKVHTDHPYTWKKLKEQWDVMYSTIPVEVNIDVRIERFGRTQAAGHLIKRD
ncbi:Ger(x)C family spore germination protein [Paenibacillus sp. TH7-28]